MRDNAPLLISLGFSNQTRLVIDHFGAELAAMPFDDVIMTRTGLMDALRTEGRSIGRPSSDGEDAYETCWTQFAGIARSEASKNFVLSNADHSLRNRAGIDMGFGENFGLDRSTFTELIGALDAFGARNYTITFLSQSLGEIEDTATLRDPRLDHRFVGTLSLHPHIRVAAGLFGAFAEPSLSAACGAYERARKLVKAINPDVAIIYDISAGRALPCGSLTRLNGGFAAFFEGRDQCLTAVSAEHGLYFSNGARWSRDRTQAAGDHRTDG